MPGARVDFTVPLALIGIGLAVSVPRIVDWANDQSVTRSAWLIAAVGAALILIGIVGFLRQTVRRGPR
jgi:hypothetical protein